MGFVTSFRKFYVSLLTQAHSNFFFFLRRERLLSMCSKMNFSSEI